MQPELGPSAHLSGTSTLAGIRVIDLATGVGGPFCARLLGDLGAEVIKVEPPDGDSARSLSPLDSQDGESALFAYLNWNKQGIVLDLDDERDRRRLLDHVTETTIVVESFSPGHLSSLGLGFAELSRQYPGVIVTSVTPFGQTGPRAHWQHSEITDWAMSGYMYFGGHPDKAPLLVPGHQAELHAAQAAALASLAASFHRSRSGVGQHIDQSIQEAMLSTHAWNSVAWTHEGVVIRRAGSGLIQCLDGWLMFQRRFYEESIFILIDRIDLMDDARFKDDEVWRDPNSEIWKLVGEWCMGQSMLDVYHSAQELRIPVTPVATPRDILNSAQLASRDWLITLEDDAPPGRTFPGFPFSLSRTSPALRRSAPALKPRDVERDPGSGESAGIGARNAGTAPSALPTAVSQPSGALDGLTVLEVTANWAGPLAGRHLGDLGARVIKIEAPHRPATRMLWYAGSDTGKYPHNRSGYFNKLNRNKYGVSLDISVKAGREVFLNLIESADVLIENNSARVMPNLGLDYATLSARNPRLIMASISGFGTTGPERDYVAYGANIEASCGLAAVTGYGDGIPYRVGSFYADPIAANYAVIAILAALHERQRSGLGQFIDIALNECAITFAAESIIEHQVMGSTPHRGNRSPNNAPQGTYQCVGDDQWVTLAVESDGQWHALCGLIGRTEWADDRRFANVRERQQHHDTIDDAVRDWAASFGHNEAAALLQGVGVPAAPVLKNWELLSDAHLFHRDFYIPIEHAEVGVYRFPGMPWKLGATPGTVRLAAPLFGEHTADVLGRVAGLSDDEIAALEHAGVTSREPTVHSVIKRNT